MNGQFLVALMQLSGAFDDDSHTAFYLLWGASIILILLVAWLIYRKLFKDDNSD